MMPEGDGGGGGGGGGGTGAGGGSGGAGDAGKKGAQPEVFSREYVHELREENKSWRQKHQESETARKSAEEARDKATKESGDKVKEVSTAADQRVIRAELKAAALKAGMVDLDGLKLADLSKVKLNAETGEVEGADALMEEMKKAKPYLFGAASSNTSNTGGKPKPKGDDKVDVSKMTPEEYSAHKQTTIRAARNAR